MISENLKLHLLERDAKSVLEFGMLVNLLDVSEYEFIGSRLMGPMGMATYRKVYFDMSRLGEVDDQLVFFVILHEYCHVLKIEKIGKEEMINQLSNENFDEFLNHIITEEILADRFASIMYYHYNKKHYPRYRTQMLEKQSEKDKYVYQVEDLFGKIKDEETYDKMINLFVLE
jgi:predicted metalloprotease